MTRSTEKFISSTVIILASMEAAVELEKARKVTRPCIDVARASELLQEHYGITASRVRERMSVVWMKIIMCCSKLISFSQTYSISSLRQ